MIKFAQGGHWACTAVFLPANGKSVFTAVELTNDGGGVLSVRAIVVRAVALANVSHIDYIVVVIVAVIMNMAWNPSF
jgi:hypothetical protein